MGRWSIAFSAALLLLAAPAESQPPSSTAIRAADFLNSLGVNVHMGYTDGAYANAANVLADLNYIGVHQLRDAAPDPNGGIPYRNYLVSLDALARAGNKFDFVVFAGLPISESLAQIDRLATAYPGVVIAVEGPNEVNNWPISYAGRTGEIAALTFQKDLYRAVKADARLAGVPVYYFTGGGRVDLTQQAGLADFANAHPYPYRGQQPGPRIAQEFADLFGRAGPYPKVITETGYYNQPSNPYGSGVDDATQAKGTLNLFLDAAKQGVSKTYVYQLLSAYPDPAGTNTDTEYGLFRLDNSPKPVATALHNLTTILADTGRDAASFAPGRLNYTLSGLPASGNSLLMQTSNGTYQLAVWAEPAFWDEATHRPVLVSPSSVTVGLGGTFASVKVFDPLLGTSPIRTLTNVGGVLIGVSDHPVIVEASPMPSQAGSTGPPR